MMKIKNWCVTAILRDDPYCPPECRVKPGNPALMGLIESHPDPMVMDEIKNQPPDCDTNVRTSSISKVTGRRVTTRSGSVYYLTGAPGKAFKTFLADNDLPYIPSNPLFPLIENGYIKLDVEVVN